jgi:NADH-quinone oxidoreductase subunit M
MFCASGMVFGAAYSLWLLNRILFGNFKNYSIKENRDLTRLEFFLSSSFWVLNYFFRFIS